MKVRIEKEKDCEVEVSIEIPKDKVILETEEVYKHIQAHAALPGFRTGKAPMEMVRRNFADRAQREVIDRLIGNSLTDALKEKKISFVSWPRVEKLDFKFEKPFLFTVKVEKEPEFKLKTYKGLKVTKRLHTAGEKQVDDAIRHLLDQHSTLVDSSSESVGPSHFILIDYEGSLEGKPLPQTKGENQLLNMTAPQTVSGFAEGLMSAKKGETRDIQVTFPAEYPEKTLAGKKVDFRVTIKEIKEKKLPAFDDEFAKDLGLESAAVIRQNIETNLKNAAQKKIDREIEDQLVEGVLEAHPFPVPPSQVEHRLAYLIQRMKTNMERQGVPMPPDTDESVWKDRFQAQAVREVRLSYLLHAIAKQENLAAGDKELAALKEQANASNKENSPEQKEWIEKYFLENREKILLSSTEENVMNFLKQHAKIKEEAVKV